MTRRHVDFVKWLVEYKGLSGADLAKLSDYEYNNLLKEWKED